MLKTLYSLLALGLILSVASCKKKDNTGPTGPTGPAGPAGPSYKGAIHGHVTLYDQYGAKLANGMDNIELTLKGGKTASADAKGYYLFSGISTGNYTLQAAGGSFATTTLNNVQFISDTLYQDIKLSAKPDFGLTSFVAYHNPGSLYDSLIITLPAELKLRNCIVFVGNSPTVNNQPGNYLLAYIKPVNSWAGSVALRIPANELNAAGIFYGETVYFAAYSYVINDMSVYVDQSTGDNVYNAVGSKLTSSAICP